MQPTASLEHLQSFASRLFYAYRSLVRATFWPAATALLLLIGFHRLYVAHPDRTELAASTQSSVDFQIVEHQLDRIAHTAPGAIALFGDSACLMGIDPRVVSRFLDGRKIESFCTI